MLPTLPKLRLNRPRPRHGKIDLRLQRCQDCERSEQAIWRFEILLSSRSGYRLAGRQTRRGWSVGLHRLLLSVWVRPAKSLVGFESSGGCCLLARAVARASHVRFAVYDPGVIACPNTMTDGELCSFQAPMRQRSLSLLPLQRAWRAGPFIFRSGSHRAV
jgi:hypothetical protein